MRRLPDSLRRLSKPDRASRADCRPGPAKQPRIYDESPGGLWTWISSDDRAWIERHSNLPVCCCRAPLSCANPFLMSRLEILGAISRNRR